MIVRRVPDVPSPVLAEAYDVLRGRGHEVAATIAEDEVRLLQDLEPEEDFYVLKSHTELSLSLAGILHARGAHVHNPYLACAATQNKFVATRLLADAGVPVPRTWALGDASAFEELLTRRSLIVKPYMGHRGADVHLVGDVEGLAAAAGASPVPVLVQEHVPGPGEDLKVYVIGDEVFALRKPFSETSFAVPGRPVPVDPEVRRIALRAGRALGLSLYGLDVIESPEGPVVVDANYVPGYKGVPDAGALIGEHLDELAGAATRTLARAA
ncbi:MAG: ATP-grasp domain-containing protein [Solirubrobacteraceae bacterium]